MKEIVEKIKNGMLRWFEFESMSEKRLTKQLYKAIVSEAITRRRPRRTILDQIGDELMKGHLKSTRNLRVCMKTDECKAMEVC